MGGDIAKQMLEIDGKPILRHTVELFRDLSFDVEIIIVINSNLREEWKTYCRKSGFEFRHILVSGGITRFHSVKNAIKYLEPGGIVAVHDAVRPFASKELITRLYSKIEEGADAVIPVVPVTDSLRIMTDEGNRHVERDGMVSVQTPQIFRTEVLIESYMQPYDTSFTDDASVVERSGYKIEISEGERYNIKLTTAEDMTIAKAIFSSLYSQE